MTEQIQALLPAITLLAAGVIAILASNRLRLSPVVGFLVVGVTIGAGGLGLVEENATTALLAELGVVLLLFDIGLTFSLRRIWEVRLEIFGLGPLQILFCGLAFSGGLFFLGVPALIAILGGFALAFSSTAVVSQVIADRRMEASPVTQSALAVLVVQDIAAIALLILLASVSDGQGQGLEAGQDAAQPALAALLGLAAGKAAAAFVATLLLRRFAVAPVFGLLARSRNDDVITSAALLLVLGAAALTGWAGLSLTLGAFLAGMMLADTPYQYTVQAEIKPFRGILLGFFFLSIGMALDPGVLISSLHWVMLALGGCLTVKLALIIAASLATGASLSRAVRLAFLVAQGSEFAFIVLNAGPVAEGMGPTLHGVLVASIGVSLALTPWMATWGSRLATAICRRTRGAEPEVLAPATVALPSVIVRLEPVSRRVANALSRHQIPYVVVEDDYDRFAQGVSEGFPVIYGDITNLKFADTVGMGERPLLIIPQVSLDVVQRVSRQVVFRFPNLVRIAGVDRDEDAAAYARFGGVGVILRVPPRGVELAAEALRRHGITEERIAEWIADQQRTLAEDDAEDTSRSEPA